MIKPILLYGDNTLRMTSKPVDTSKGHTEIKVLIDDLFETMHKAGGIGLSAIQIGVPLRVFVIEYKFDKENVKFRQAFINPEIVFPSEVETKMYEGCLSIPGLQGMVNRPESIKLKFLDEEFKTYTKGYSGIPARIIQHELDHLDGKLYIDHLEPMWKDIMNESLKNIEHREIKPNYLHK